MQLLEVRGHELRVLDELLADGAVIRPRLERAHPFVDGPDVPVYEHAGARVRVVAGASGDARGKLQPPGDITLAAHWAKESCHMGRSS